MEVSAGKGGVAGWPLLARLPLLGKLVSMQRDL